MISELVYDWCCITTVFLHYFYRTDLTTSTVPAAHEPVTTFTLNLTERIRSGRPIPRISPRISSIRVSVQKDPVLDDPVEMTQSSFLIGLRLATKILTDIRYL